MTATATRPPESRALAPLLERVEREHFPASRFTQPRPGKVAAQFFASRLTSAFQPIVRACDNGVAGHHALLRVFDAADAAVAPWRILAHAAEDAMLVQLDRLTRTLHALNYFAQGDPMRRLYLNVEERLLSIVADRHGAYFELILSQLGVPTSRVAIVLPPGALEDPVTFVRAATAYRIRGYRVVAQLASATDADLEHIFLAEPHDVAFDAPPPGRGDAALRRLIDALSRRGIHAIARRVENEEQARTARDAGFGFLTGWHFNRTAPI